MKRVLSLPVFFLLVLLPVFSISILGIDTDDLSAVLSAISASYLNPSRIELEGVSYVDGQGMLPSAVFFSSSDASTYLDSMLAGANSSFLARITTSMNPIFSKAKTSLETRGFKKGDLVIDGRMDISGGESLDILSIIVSKDYSNIRISCSGSVIIKGNRIEQDMDLLFNALIAGDKNKKIIVDTTQLDVNGKSTNMPRLIIGGADG